MIKSILTFLIILFFHLTSTESVINFNVTYELDITDNHQTFEKISRRSRREPAVWGEPAPDYSDVQLNDYIHLLNALIFIDSKITKHYGSDVEKAKKDVMKLIQEANNYFYQINIRIIVIDILETYRNDLSLYSFEEYRNRRISELPTHDFAALISHRYAGGLAFVNGMCTSKNVMLCGFYPHNPSAMGGIFFHEVAHLFGVAHRNATDSIDAPNCYCQVNQITTVSGCLKIPGYDHDCALQQMVNMLEKNRCLKHIKTTSFFFTQHTVEKSFPLCGNGIIEDNEECDCGLQKLCYNWNCRANDCLQILKTWQMYICGWITAVLTIIVMVFNVIRRNSWLCYNKLSNHSFDNHFPFFTNFKSIIRPKSRHYWHRADSNYEKSLRLTVNDIVLAKHHLIEMPYKSDSKSLAVLIAPIDERKSTTIIRPTKPPPPPPSFLPRNISDKVQSTTHSVSLFPLVGPPSLPVKPPNLSLKMIITGNDDAYEMPNTVKRRLSSMVQSNIIDYSGQDYADHYDSISRKFDDDFDDDFDDEKILSESHPVEKEHQPIHYTVPVKERSFEQDNKSLKPMRLHHLDQISKLFAYNESFSSNESRSQPYPSDDTVSTGLSEEDEQFISVTHIVKKFNAGKF